MAIKDIFSIRHPMEDPMGMPKDFVGGDIYEPPLVKLYGQSQLHQYIRNDNLQIPATADREGYYGDRHLEYWLSGLRDYLAVVRSVSELEIINARILDFGGATGRVSRHFYCQGGARNICICDVNINNVEWVLENFPTDFEVFKNSFLPSLPLPDASFDLVLAFSVFTHTDVHELGWLMELRRIVKPGGILYLTIHNDDTWDILPKTYVYQIVSQSEVFRDYFRPGSNLKERISFSYSEEEGYNCNTFHPNSYVKRVWGRLFTLLNILPLEHSYQSGVVLQKIC